MALILNRLMGSGLPAALAQAFCADIADNQTAAGTTQTDALSPGGTIIRCTTVASGTGVRLYSGTRGDSQIVINDGANGLSVYPPVGQQIKGLSTNAAFSIPANAWASFERVTNTLWIVGNDSATVSFLQSGTGAVAEPVQTALRRWAWAEQYGAAGDGVTDDAAAIRRVWAAGFAICRLMGGKTYKVNSALQPTQGQFLVGEGKSKTTILLGADVILLDLTDVNDVGANNFLVTPFASQSNPIVRLTAATASMTRNIFEDIQVGGTAQTFTVVQLRATGAFGVWGNDFNRFAVSGVGTIVEFNTSNAGAWMRQNRIVDLYANDYVIGADFVRSAGAGGCENICRNWNAQTSARTTFAAFRIPASGTLQNSKNLFDGVSTYDLPAGCVYYNIGAGVEDTEIRGPTAVDYPNTAKFVDNGVRTKNRAAVSEAAALFGLGHFLPIPTCAGWTEAVTGSGSTALQAAYCQTRTGTTVSSTARRYTETVGGFASNSVFGINYDKPLIFRFNLGRATTEANAVGRVQLKTVQTEGALAAKGLGVRITNYALFGESYGTSGAFVDLSTTMTDSFNYQVEIRHYPADRIEWWVDGVFKASQSTAGNIPSGTQTVYLVHSLITTVSNPSGDAQMFLALPSLWVDL